MDMNLLISENCLKRNILASLHFNEREPTAGNTESI